MPPLPTLPPRLASALLLCSRLALSARLIPAPIPAGARCRFGAGTVRAYPTGDNRYTVIAEDDLSERLGVRRDQLEVA